MSPRRQLRLAIGAYLDDLERRMRVSVQETVATIKAEQQAAEPEPPAPEPMTVEKLVAKIRPKFVCSDWRAVEADLQELVDATEKRCELIACLHSVCEKRIRCSEPKPEPAAAEAMTVEQLIAEWWQSLGPLCLRGKVKAKLIELVREQARRDAKLVERSGWNYGPNTAKNILKAAGLQ